MSSLFDGIEDVVPIPETCKELKQLFNYSSVQAVADEMIRQIRTWQDEHPDKDVMDILPPTIKEYIQYRLEQ